MSLSEAPLTLSQPVVSATEPTPRIPIPWARATGPLAVLAGAMFSLTSLAYMVVGDAPARNQFLLRNVVSAAIRRELVVALLGAAAVPVVAGLIFLMVLRERAIRPLERARDLTAPLIPAVLIPAAFDLQLGRSSAMPYLVLLGLLALALEPLLRRTFVVLDEMGIPEVFSAWRRLLARLHFPAPRVFWFGLVVLAAAAYSTYTGYFTIQHHHRLGTTAFDLGIYDNLMYEALHGHPFRSPVLFGPPGGNYLAGHAEFAMLLFLPFYAIRPGPETMLIMQAILLGFAAVPLYLFAATRLPRPTAAAVAVAYLLFAPLHGPNFYDFHWLPLAIFFHFWLYYAIARRKTWLTVVMVVILFAFREDVAVGLAILGLFLLVTGLRPRLGMWLAIASSVWFVIVRFAIMPLAGSWYFMNFYSDLFADGAGTYGSVIKTIVSNPTYFLTTLVTEAKLVYALHMLAPLAFLPLRQPALGLLMLPGFFFTIMTTGYGPTLQISFQYTTHWIPYLFLATVLGLAVIWIRRGTHARRAAVATLAVVMLAHSYNFGAILQRGYFVGGFSKIEFKMTPAEKARWKGMKELLAMIPKKASVAATEQEAAHVSTRLTIFPLRLPPGPVDYILVNRYHIGDLSRTSLNAALANHDEYGLLAERADELFLFKRGYKSPGTAAARVKLGVP